MIAASLRALLTRVIDYAGMFPPASLSLDESIRNYARYVNEPESWMLGRFICPTARLADANALFAELFPSGGASLSALGQDASTIDEDLKLIDAFGRQRIGSFEARFGKSGDPQMSFARDRVFFERAAPCGGFGFKLRTGGVEAAAFPPVERIARCIIDCRAQRLPIKFTAGLHHPIRHFNSSVNTKMHGFINVFVAGVLAHALQLAEEQLISILNDEDPASFRFDDDGLHYKEYRATTRQIEDARRQLVISFGSCSFDEPREDLRSLGWL